MGRALPTDYFVFPAGEKGRIVVHESLWEGEEGWFGSAPTPSMATFSSESPTQKRFQLERVRVPRARLLTPPTEQRYILLKKYEGFVVSRTASGFTARLWEGASDYPVLEAEFDLEELSETDRELAVEGAALVWTIGYRYDGSTRKKESAIYVRRLPAWTSAELDQARKTADELVRGIEWE